MESKTVVIFRNSWVLLNILYYICEIKENRLNDSSSRQPVYFFPSGNLLKFLALIVQYCSCKMVQTSLCSDHKVSSLIRILY